MIFSAVALVVLVLVVGGVGAATYFATRGARAGDSFTFRGLLRAYVRGAFLVSLVVCMVGAVMTLTTGFGAAFGHDFSYSPGYGSSSICKGSDKSQLSCTQSSPGQGNDPRPQEDLIRGLSLLVAGLVIGAGHKAGQLALESRAERLDSGLARAEDLLGTVGFGLVSIIALPLAAYALLSYYLISNNSANDTPGPNLAMALVFAPAWGYYLFSFVRRVRAHRPAEAGATP